MKYEDMKDKEVVDKYGFKFIGDYHMLGKTPGKCLICKEDTHSIDVFSEQYICSEECQNEFDSIVSAVELQSVGT